MNWKIVFLVASLAMAASAAPQKTYGAVYGQTFNHQVDVPVDDQEIFQVEDNQIDNTNQGPTVHKGGWFDSSEESEESDSSESEESEESDSSESEESGEFFARNVRAIDESKEDKVNRWYDFFSHLTG